MPASALDPPIVDPLLTGVQRNYEAIFYPYGFPVRISSNSSLVIEAAQMSWGTYRLKFPGTPFDLRMLISESSSASQMQPPISRSQGHLVTVIVDAENFVCIDLDAGFAFGWATPATAANTHYFRQCQLDAMVFYFLEIRHLLILHAACVMFKGKGILLAGDSGAGKSSLAYACARRGWTYVADDESALLRNTEKPIVIGHPHRFRFRDSASELFPELQGLKTSVRVFGKRTIEVNTHSFSALKKAEESPVDAILFLNRTGYQTAAPTLTAVSREEAWARLGSSLWHLQLPAFEERLMSLERLLNIPLYELSYESLDPAIDLLENLARTL